MRFLYRVDLMLGPGWHLFGTDGHDFGTTGDHCGTPGQQVAVWGTHVWNLMRFWYRVGSHWGSIWPLLPDFSGLDFGGGFGRAQGNKSLWKWEGPAAVAGLLSLL